MFQIFLKAIKNIYCKPIKISRMIKKTINYFMNRLNNLIQRRRKRGIKNGNYSNIVNKLDKQKRTVIDINRKCLNYRILYKNKKVIQTHYLKLL